MVLFEVDNAELVSGFCGFGDLSDTQEGFLNKDRPRRDPIFERLAFGK